MASVPRVLLNHVEKHVADCRRSLQVFPTTREAVIKGILSRKRGANSGRCRAASNNVQPHSRCSEAHQARPGSPSIPAIAMRPGPETDGYRQAPRQEARPPVNPEARNVVELLKPTDTWGRCHSVLRIDIAAGC